MVHVAGPRGLLTGRTRNGLLSVAATTGPDAVELVPSDAVPADLGGWILGAPYLTVS